jgi:hypothetical protein
LNHIAAILAPFLLVACASSTPASPQAAAPQPPAADDVYSQLVERAEAGDDKVDFLEMRMAYLQSPAFLKGRAAVQRVRDLREAMFSAMSSGDNRAVNAKAEETLRLVYIDLEAQKARYQSCARLGDEACAAQGKRIEQGLLKSVVSLGNGRSCLTAWKVVRVDEEYFILRMLDMSVTHQSVVEEGGRVCDKMEVTDEAGDPAIYYFDIGDMLKAEEALLTAGH